MDWRTFKTKFEKRLNLQDPNYLEIIFATALAHRIHGDPPWLFWVAQSGGGKTEVLRTFRDVDDIKYIESMTTKTLVSHFGTGRGGKKEMADFSLIPKLKDKCLIIKDFTNILSLRFETREEIFSQLRCAYDGEYDTATGLGEKSYKVKFGILAGVTPAIEKRKSLRGTLGERFLMVKTIFEDKDLRQAKVRDAIKNAIIKPKIREELKELTTEMMDSVPIKHEDMDFKFNVSRDQHEWFARMAELLARMRGTIPRNGYGKHEIIDEPDIELGTRIADQIMHLFVALRLLVDKDDALRATARVVKDSIPSIRAKMAEYAYKRGKLTMADYPSAIAYGTLQRHADDLVALGVFSREGDGEGYIYRLEKDLVDDVAGLFGGEKELRKQRPGMWE